jgi:pimeloyl-ACP methyl ester carboxylesterase
VSPTGQRIGRHPFSFATFGEQQAAIMREVGSQVEGGIITRSGHWIMEDQPAQTVSVVKAFLDKK